MHWDRESAIEVLRLARENSSVAEVKIEISIVGFVD